jgi:hypothetical protein
MFEVQPRNFPGARITGVSVEIRNDNIPYTAATTCSAYTFESECCALKEAKSYITGNTEKKAKGNQHGGRGSRSGGYQDICLLGYKAV